MLLYFFILMLHPPADDDVDQGGNEYEAHRPSEVCYLAAQVVSDGDVVIETHVYDVHDYGTGQEEDVQFGDAWPVHRQINDVRVNVEMNTREYANEMARATFVPFLLHGFDPF